MKALWIKIVLLAVALPGVWGNVAAQVTISADFDTGSIGSVRRIDSVRMLHAAKNSLEVMSFGIRIIRKSKCSTDFKRNDFLKKNEAYPLGALRSLKFAYRKLRISLFVELAV